MLEGNNFQQNNVQTQASGQLCSQCGSPIKPGARFCSVCGRPVNVAPAKKFCNRCGAEIKEGAMFCPTCGAATAQSRDAEVMNNIAAYNSSVGKPVKKSTPITINGNSFFSLLVWLGTAVAAAMLVVMLVTGFSYDGIDYFDHSYPLFAVISAVAYISVSVSGILLWNKDKKIRVLPIVFSLIGCLAILSTEHIGIWRCSIALGIGVFVSHILAFLFAIKVIKTKTAALISAFGGIAFAVLLPVLVGGLFFFKWGFYAAVFSAPAFLLTLSFTTKELKEKPKKKLLLRKIISLLLVVLIILGGAGIGFYSSWVYVSDTVSMPVAEAREELSRLSVKTVHEFNDTVAKNVVISQSVEAGEYVHPGSSIALTVSKGKGIKVPNLKNLTLNAAKAKLEALGLTAQTTYEYNNTVAKDKVVGAKETLVEAGGKVQIVISKGRDLRVTVPDVTYCTEADAKSKLKKAGFKVNVNYVYESCDAYYKTSSVKSQSLTGKQNKGSTVTISVTKPSVQVTKVDFDQNSVGGVDVEISLKNTSNRTIKYVVFTARFKNAVGDEVYCDIRHNCVCDLKVTGPVYSGKSTSCYWDAVIYNWNCKQIYFDEIKVIFMDDTTHTMTYGGYWYS